MIIESNPEIYQKTTFVYNTTFCKCVFGESKCIDIHRPIVVTYDYRILLPISFTQQGLFSWAAWHDLSAICVFTSLNTCWREKNLLFVQLYTVLEPDYSLQNITWGKFSPAEAPVDFITFLYAWTPF